MIVQVKKIAEMTFNYICHYTSKKVYLGCDSRDNSRRK